MPLRPPPQCVKDFVGQAEDDELVAYPDSGGDWTIGRGHTKGVVKGMTITEAQSLAFRDEDLGDAATELAGVVSDKEIWSLSDHQYGALLSFVFNLGAEPDWTIWKLLNAGELAGVPDQMKRFDKIKLKNGTVMTVPGLDARRLAEVTLWNTADVAAAVAIVQAAPVQAPSSSVTRAADTPPTPPIVKPLAQSKSFTASCATAAAGVAACVAPYVQGAADSVKSVNDAITPYAEADHRIAAVQHGMVMVMAGCAVATALLMILKHHDDKAV